MTKSSNIGELTISLVAGTISLAVIVGTSIYNLSKNKKQQSIEPEYYNKFYQILYKESGLDKDPHSRDLSSSTVKIFCKIAKSHGIKLEDPINSKTFDKLYGELVEYQINKAKINKIIS